MVCYSSGVVAVFLVFVLLHWNAYRHRDALALSAVDIYDIGTSIRAHGFSTMLGVTSIILATTLPANGIAFSGLIYVLEGPFQGYNGFARGSGREKRFPSRRQSAPDSPRVAAPTSSRPHPDRRDPLSRC